VTPLPFRLCALACALSLLACGAPAPGGDGGETLDGGDAGLESDAGSTLLSLAPGEVVELTLEGGLAGGRLATPLGTERFVAVLVSTRFDALSTSNPYAFNVGTALVSSEHRAATGCALTNAPWSATPPPVETPPVGSAPDAGATRTLMMPTATGTEIITVQAIGSSASAVVWADVTPAHPADLDAGFVSQFLQDFENVILPRGRALFGVESDVDGDGHVGLVFSPLTRQTAVAFFSACDLKALAGCPSGNGGEYLYLTPPSAIAPPYNTPNAIKEILSHEASHLLHFNRKVLRNRLGDWPDSSYLIEGIGGFAQDAIGPQAGNLHVAKAGLDGIDSFSLSDVLVDGVPYDTTRDGVLRGGSYLFVRWLYDRAGGDQLDASNAIAGLGGPALLRAVLDANTSAASALTSATGRTHAELATDFFTALAMSNQDQNGGAAPANGCFAFRPTSTDPVWNRQRGANLYAQFSLKMTGPSTQVASFADGRLRAGGAEFLVLDATAAGELPFSVQLAASTPARLRVGRVR
jgi:hypothetical protein